MSRPANRSRLRKAAGRRLAVAIGLAVVAGAAFAAFVLSNRYVPPQDLVDAPWVAPPPVPDDLSWRAYGGDPGQTRHSQLAQITVRNVAHLRLAWTYRTGELARRGRWAKAAKFQSTPILAAGHLVFCTPFGRVVALDRAEDFVVGRIAAAGEYGEEHRDEEAHERRHQTDSWGRCSIPATNRRAV